MLLGAAHAALLALALGYFSRRRRCVWCREGASDHSSETAVLLPYKCRAEGAAAGRLEAQQRRRHQTAPLHPLATGPALQAASRVSSLSSLGQTTHHAGSKAAERLFPASCPPLNSGGLGAVAEPQAKRVEGRSSLRAWPASVLGPLAAALPPGGGNVHIADCIAAAEQPSLSW